MMPIQCETCQMHELDLFPQTKPVQATFEPVMIRGDNQEQDGETGERPIAGQIPIHFVKSYCADCSDDEDNKAPAGECGTRCSGPGDHAVELFDQACQ